MAGRWQDALGVMEDMVMEGVAPNSLTYASAINACGKSRQLARALDLLSEARLAGIEVRQKRGWLIRRYVYWLVCGGGARWLVVAGFFIGWFG